MEYRILLPFLKLCFVVVGKRVPFRVTFPTQIFDEYFGKISITRVPFLDIFIDISIFDTPNLVWCARISAEVVWNGFSVLIQSAIAIFIECCSFLVVRHDGSMQ